MAWSPRFESRLSEANNLDVVKMRRLLVQHGYVILRKWLAPDVLMDLSTALTRLQNESLAALEAKGLLKTPVPTGDLQHRLARIVAEQPSVAAHVPTLYREQLHEPEFFDLFFAADMLDLMLTLTGGDEVRLFPNYTARPKIPGSAAHTVPWHQDAGLTHDGKPNESDPAERLEAFGMVGECFRTLNCWTCLVPATPETGCMQFVPGSHHAGLLQHKLVGRVAAADGTEHGAAETQGKPIFVTQIDPEEVTRLKLDEAAVDILTQPGDVVLFSNMLAHRAHPNTKADIVRWSFDWRYQDASQPTLRPLQGHIARSLLDMDRETQTAEEWAALTLA